MEVKGVVFIGSMRLTIKKKNTKLIRHPSSAKEKKGPLFGEAAKRSPLKNVIQTITKTCPRRQSGKQPAFPEKGFVLIQNWLPDCLLCRLLQKHMFYNGKTT